MADPSSVKSMQEALTASLHSVGYKGGAGTLHESLAHNQKLLGFLEWTITQIKPDNYVTPEQCKSFESLKSDGKTLEGHALRNALRKLGSKAEGTADMEKEVADMKGKVAALKKQLQTLNSVQQSLGEHYTSLLHEQDEVARQKADIQKSCHKSLQEAEGGDKIIDVALEELCSAVKELCTFHRCGGKGETVASPGSVFVSDLSQDSYHKAEDEYLARLTAYTKKQFFKGLTDLAHSQGPDEEEFRFACVNLDDLDQALLRGVSEGQHEKHQKELSRLQALYPVTEIHHINAVLAMKHAEAAAARAEQEIKMLEETPADKMDCDSLKRQTEERQEKVASLRAQVQALGQGKLVSLLQDMAVLQVTRVLHGDYDLKLARQDYFTSKQDKVISRLQSQRARHELLSMLYEVELRRHRDTHRLLAATEKHLTQLREDREKRMRAMENPSLRKVEGTRIAIDSRDTFSQRLCTMLGVKSTDSSPLLSHASLCQAVEQLVHQVAALEGVLAANDEEMKQIISKQECLAIDFEGEIFSGSKDQDMCSPTFTVKEYEEQCSNLSSMVASLEVSIKKLLKDYDGKKKVLKSDPLLETQRKLFLYFFTNPAMLEQVIGDLAKRINSITLAHQ